MEVTGIKLMLTGMMLMLTGMTSMLTGMIVTVMRNLVEGPRRVQGITVVLFFLRIGSSTSFYL